MLRVEYYNVIAMATKKLKMRNFTILHFSQKTGKFMSQNRSTDTGIDSKLHNIKLTVRKAML